ncbi:uncharacterized protein LOC144132291 [Amblyomma americanum]
MPRHRQNHCYAPGCQTGYVYVKGGQKLSLFGVPKDENRRKEWEKNLHRADKPLDDTSAVCELHFEPRYVLRDYVHVIQGKEVRIARGKPILRADAVPTILPNLPTYLTKKPTQETTARKRKRSETSDGQPKPAFCPFDNAVAVPWSCRYLKRALLTRRSRVQRKTTKARHSVAHKLKTAVRKNKRLSTRLADTRESLVKIQEQVAAKKEDVLQEQIESLTPRQQEAVKHCFAAAKVKPNGLRYSKSWLLDCIIMKMKSPRLYEHLRKNKILALPSKSTLKRYVSIYRTLFGFNEKILKKLESLCIHLPYTFWLQ